MNIWRKGFGVVFIIAIICVFYFVFISPRLGSKETEEESAPIKEEKINPTDEIVKELIEKYNATNYEEAPKLTFQMKESIKKPIVFKYVDLVDIYEENGKWYGVFDDNDLMVLEIDPGLTKRADELESKIIIMAAKIDSFKKIIYTVDTEIDGEDAEIRVYPAYTFKMTGKLLEVRTLD